jgi:HAD superfamily hydrolase (TIGR01509 family)
VDTEYLKFLSWQKALTSIQIDLSLEEYKILAGHSSKKIIEILQEIKNTEIPEKIIHLRNLHYQGLQPLGVKPIQEMVELARILSKNKSLLGIKLGLASSATKHEILFNLKQIGLEEAFVVIISGTDDLFEYSDLNEKNKPKPYIYLETSKQLNVSPKNCIVFEDTSAGIEAAVNAGMTTIAIPNHMTDTQDFSKANKVTTSLSELSTDIINSIKLPFKLDEDLEKNSSTSSQRCLQEFFQKGGTLQCISNIHKNNASIRLNMGDAVYPICSGGWCRSQTLWAILKPFSHQIILFPPHAARLGWDPYNGQINRYRNYAKEAVYDEFSFYFGMEKSLRFGFENSSKWEPMERYPSSEGLQAITKFYNEYYYGPSSSWQGKQGKNRIYIAFSKNAHITLYRLNQANENLNNVTVIAIDSEDLITHPPDYLQTTPRSMKSYKFFADSLAGLLDLSKIETIENQEKKLLEFK